MIEKNKLALLFFGVFDFYMTNTNLFTFFYKDVLSQALSEDAA